MKSVSGDMGNLSRIPSEVNQWNESLSPMPVSISRPQGKLSTIRWTAVFLSFLSLPVLLMGLIAPFGLLMGVIWLSAVAGAVMFEKRFDRLGAVIALIGVGAVLGVCFIPLWIAERTAKTPDDFVMLAEGFRRRGQILGNRTKTQAYYLKAAESGNVEAQARVGEALYFGHYGTTNRDEGMRWIKVAASNGHQRSQQLLPSIESN